MLGGQRGGKRATKVFRMLMVLRTNQSNTGKEVKSLPLGSDCQTGEKGELRVLKSS